MEELRTGGAVELGTGATKELDTGASEEVGTALAPAPSAALLSAIPLPSPGGGDVFIVVVPPTRPSLGFAKKKVVG